jgi:hypothetical protein
MQSELNPRLPFPTTGRKWVMSFKAGNHLRFAEALLAISISANAFTADAQVGPNVASASGSASATPNLNLRELV